MTLDDLITQLKDVRDRFPNAAQRDVKMLTSGPGRSEVEDVAVSATQNVWLLGRESL